MGTFKKTSLIIFAIFLVNCENEQISTVEKSQVEKVLKLEGQAQRDAYNVLESKLKHDVWVTKLTKDKESLNNQQKIIVNQLLDMISPYFFTEDYQKNDEVTKRNIKEWFYDAKEVFSKHELISVFSSLNGPDPKTNRATSSGGCSCNTSEDYCSFGLECETAVCQVSGWGCGLLWNSTCNGECE